MTAEPLDAAPLASSNARIKRLRRLAGRRSARLDEGAFLIEGPTNVAEALRCGVAIEEVFVEPSWLGGVFGSARVTRVAEGALRRALDTDNPQPVCAVAPTTLARPVTELTSIATRHAKPVLVLVDVADPGNAGTLLRSADAAGAAGVVFTGRCVDAYSPKVVRSSAGSLFRVPFAIESDPEAVFAALSELPRLAAAADGDESHLSAALDGAVAIVLGNEAHGLDVADRARCTSSVRIEMDGPTESLNVAMAGTVLLFESMRRRHAGRDHNDAR